MKLLIVTQKVDQNDPILGFFCRWIEEFAKHYEKVTVICLEEGNHVLPMNVIVYSLGKEQGASRIQYGIRFYQLIWKLRNEYDTVFVHMNPEYIVLAGLIWKMLHKKIALWYVHRKVDIKLRIAEMFSDTIFTSAKESFGLESKKIHYVGHGIDIQRFEHIAPATYEPLIIMHIGRVTRIKHIEVIIKALQYLNKEHIPATLKLVGEPVTRSDKVYKEELKSLIKSLGLGRQVVWSGSMSNVDALSQASITVNAAPDGGMDKAVLESLAAGRAAFVSNTAFLGVFEEYKDSFMYNAENSEEMTYKIKDFLQHSEKSHIVSVLFEKVKEKYDIGKLIEVINNSQ